MRSIAGLLCILIGATAQAADVQVEISLSAPDSIEVRYSLPPACKALAFENKTANSESIRASWQSLDGCGSAGGDALTRTRDACSVLRFRVPATSNTPPGYYPSAFPLVGGVYVHTSNYAVEPSCGKPVYRFTAPGIAAAGRAYEGSVVADTQATGDASALLMQAPIATSGGTVSYFDPRLSPLAVAQIKEVADGAVSYLKTVLPDATFRPPILAAVAASEPGGPNIRGSAGDVLLASFYNWPQQPGPKEREKLTLLVAHEFSHRFQLRDAVDSYPDARLIHEGGAEFLRWLTSIQKGWLTREDAAAQVDDALTQCLLYVNGQDWRALTPKAIAGNRLEYVCGLPVYVYGLAARQGKGSAFARINGFYKALRDGEKPDFAQAMECGDDAKCNARWLPLLLGAGEPMETQWGKLARETGLAQVHVPNQNQRDRMVLQAVVKLMRDDCGGRRSTTETPSGVLIDGLAVCKTLRSDIDVTTIEGLPVFGSESTLAAMVSACKDRHEVKLGAKNGGAVAVPCGAPYQVRSEFYGIDIDKVLQSLLRDSGASHAKEPVLMGVVEAQPDASALSDAPQKEHLRLAFEYQDGSWGPICKGKGSSERNDGCSFGDANELHKWEMFFNGQDLGAIQTRGWRNSEYYSFTGALTIQTSPVPAVTNAPAPFANWTGEATRRPLVALPGTNPNRIKREWTREIPGRGDAAVAWPGFKSKVPIIPNCKFDDQGKPLGKSRPVARSDMIVFDHVRLNDGSYLLGVRAKQEPDCDEAGGFASDLWLLKRGKGAAFAMEGFDTEGWPYSLSLVDIGDFAGDGSLQAVFFLAGYNEDGYVLYYDHFRKRVKFTWGYH